MTKDFLTLALNTISAGSRGPVDFTIGSDNKVEIASSAVIDSENASTYSPDEKNVYLNFKFKNSGTTCHTIETIILRQDPELDLRFEAL